MMRLFFFVLSRRPSNMLELKPFLSTRQESKPREGLAECHLANSYLDKKSKVEMWTAVEPVVAQHQAVLRFAATAECTIESPFEEKASAALTAGATSAKNAKTALKPVNLATKYLMKSFSLGDTTLKGSNRSIIQ